MPNLSNVSPELTLVGAINNAVTAITVSDNPVVAVPFYAVLSPDKTKVTEEIVLVTASAANGGDYDLTVTRAQGGTTAKSHLNGAIFAHVVIAGDIMQNPMTTANDVIVGGASGIATRLAIVASRLLGRKASGDLVGMTGDEVLALATAASQGEMEAGTEAALRLMSPLRVLQAIDANAVAGADGDNKIVLMLSDYDTDAAIKNRAAYYTFDSTKTLTGVFFACSTQNYPTVSAAQADINKVTTAGGAATSILTTKATIDAGEWSSATAATQPVIDTAGSINTFTAGQELVVDLDAVGSGAAGRGYHVILTFAP